MNKYSDLTTKVDDAVFGEMEYKHSWYRTQSVYWWGGVNLNVNITAHAYTGKGITDQQRASFSEYQKNIDNVIEKSIPIISDNLRSIFDADYTEEELFRKLVPRTVLFLENGDWGILFDTDIDIEHGIALYKQSGEWKVGLQDDFL